MFEDELRRYLLANDGPSFDTLTDEVLEAIGADPVFEGPQATGGTVYQYSQPAGVEQIDGKWYTKYILGPIFTDTTDEQGNVTTAAQHEQAYKARVDADAAKGVREERTKKLAACDWTQLADAPVDSLAWSNYRQQLRDLTKQPGFPHVVVWPDTPQ